MRIHEIILESEEPAKIDAVDALSDIERASNNAANFFKSIDKKGIEIDIDDLKRIDEDWKSKLKMAAIGGVLGLTSLLANAQTPPQEFGKIMSYCSAVNYLGMTAAANLPGTNKAALSIAKDFDSAYKKTSAIGKQLLGDAEFDKYMEQQYNKLLSKYNDGSGKVEINDLVKDLLVQSAYCDEMRKEGSKYSDLMKPGSAQDNNQSATQYSPQQIAKYWSDVKDYKGGKSKSGLPDGKGSISWSDGSTYVGNFDNGSLSGEGVMTYPSGAKFDGIFSNGGNMERGSYTFKDGSKFVGEFTTNGKPDNGRGYNASGKEIYTFVNGKKIDTPVAQPKPQPASKLSPEELRAQFKADAMRK